jgi:hypothetical protein
VTIRCRKLKKIKRELDELRRGGGQKSARYLEQLAIRLGRKKHPKGKEPTYFNEILPDLSPLSIPGHGGDLKPGTAKSILDQLDEDVFRLIEICEEDKEEDEDDET